MTASTETATKHVTKTSLFYLRDSKVFKTEKPYFLNVPVGDIPGAKQTNLDHEKRQSISITDIRGRESDYTVDGVGFELVVHKSLLGHDDFDDDAKVMSTYYLEMVEFVKSKLNATRAFVFDHTLRRRTPGIQDCGTSKWRQPLQAAHIDQTPDSVISRIKFHLNEEAKELLKKRYQIVNVWRPLHGPLKDWPLALCDYNSLDLSRDLVPTDLVFPHYEGESYNLYYNESHKWYFVDGQNVDEVWLFKCADSIQDCSVAKMAAHTSFEYSEAPADSRPRESIEVRLLVFYDD